MKAVYVIGAAALAYVAYRVFVGATGAAVVEGIRAGERHAGHIRVIGSQVMVDQVDSTCSCVVCRSRSLSRVA